MKFLLDTNVLSDARTGASAELNRWLADQRVRDLAVSVVTVLELEIGVRRVERRDPASGSHLRLWLDRSVLALFDGRVLGVELEVAKVAAGLHVPDPMPDMDALIAATAIVHGLTVVTRNVRDFGRAPVSVLDPWADQLS